MRISYQYFILNISTKEFDICFSLKDVVGFDKMLSKKKSTIFNNFKKLEKENKPTVIDDWGFKIYRKLKK